MQTSNFALPCNFRHNSYNVLGLIAIGLTISLKIYGIKMRIKYLFIAFVIVTIYAFIVIPSSQSAPGDKDIMKLAVVLLFTPIHFILILPSVVIAGNYFKKCIISRIVSAIFILAYLAFSFFSLNDLKVLPLTVIITLPCIITLFRFDLDIEEMTHRNSQ